MPVPVSPSIDRLFDISDDEQRISFGSQHILQQLSDYAPLELTGILEFVYQHMAVSDTGFLQDKIRIASLKRIAQRACCTGEKGAVRFRQIALYQRLQRGHQFHIAAKTDGQLQRVIVPCQFARQLGSAYGVFHHLLRQFGPFAGFGIRKLVLRQSAETVFRRCLVWRLQCPAEAVTGVVDILHMRQGLRHNAAGTNQPFRMDTVQDRRQLVQPFILRP